MPLILPPPGTTGAPVESAALFIVFILLPGGDPDIAFQPIKSSSFDGRSLKHRPILFRSQLIPEVWPGIHKSGRRFEFFHRRGNSKTVPGTNLLAFVTPIDAVTHFSGELRGNLPPVFNGQVRETFVTIQPVRLFQCTRRATVQATGTTATPGPLRDIVC